MVHQSLRFYLAAMILFAGTLPQSVLAAEHVASPAPVEKSPGAAPGDISPPQPVAPSDEKPDPANEKTPDIEVEPALSSKVDVKIDPDAGADDDVKLDTDVKVDDEWDDIEAIEAPSKTETTAKTDDDADVEWDDDDPETDKTTAEDKPKGPLSISGVIAAEFRVFPYNPGFADQKKSTLSPGLIIEPEIIYKWNNDKTRLTVKPYVLLDADDDNRTYFDVREANILHQGQGWDILFGISKVFWGVAESRHLVDIINQTDGVVDIDNEDKLGQPMITLTIERDWGAVSMFVLPGFRKRSFPGDKNRLRGPLPIADDNPSFEARSGKRHVDYAARWSKTIGDWDLGVSHFYGTSREPRLLPSVRADGQAVLFPRYDLINQTGLDVQYTNGAWLWKLEAISRSGQGKRFYAAVGGFEYTEYQIFDSSADLGFLMEFQYDGRKNIDAPVTFNDNDLFLATRLALNDEADTTMLAGPVIDVETGATFVAVEAERRIGANWKVDLEWRFSFFIPDNDLAAGFRKDDVLTLRLNRYF